MGHMGVNGNGERSSNEHNKANARTTLPKKAFSPVVTVNLQQFLNEKSAQDRRYTMKHFKKVTLS